MSTLRSVDVLIDDIQNGNSISAKDYFATVKDYPPVVDHATVMRWNSGVGNNVTGVGSINGNVTNASLDIIKGQMVAAEMRLDANEAIQMDDIELKNRLITKLVRELMDGKYIEFTKQQDVTKMETVIRARIYVTPDDQVRIVRKANNV
jgi:hypothetical protein